MAKTQTQTQQPVEDTDARKARIAALQAELQAERAALRAAKPTQDPVERERARQAQATTRLDHLLTKMLTRRLTVGQARDAAIADIIALCQEAVDAQG
jgi:hypothetical protein